MKIKLIGMIIVILEYMTCRFFNELTIDGNPCHFLHPGAN